MPKITVLNMRAEAVGEIDLADEVFAAEIKPHLHWEVVRNQLANRRAGTHDTKTRGEVCFSTRKIYRQKGTGRARHGSRKSTIFVGGGKSHTPHPRDYSYVLPKKVRRAALRSAISTRCQGGDLLLLDELRFEQPRTREAAALLGRLGLGKVLVVTREENGPAHLSLRNLPKAKYIRAEGVNVFDVLKYDKLLLTVDAARALEERLRQA
jgi:large subunit ribosomal protein L4